MSTEGNASDSYENKRAVVKKNSENLCNLIEIDNEIVELRRPSCRSDGKSRKVSFRRSLRESFRYSGFRKSFLRRTKSFDAQKERPKIKTKTSKTIHFLTTTLPKYVFATPMLKLHSPAPLLVKDHPSSEDGSDLEDVKLSIDPALLNGSSGNFGSAGARSAPGTPQTLVTVITSPGGISETPSSQPCSPGCTSPSIQRSPSHSLFTKCDKSSLKHLSTSTPAMTAQAQLTEPPSPKTAKEVKVPTMSKARQKKFNRHFPQVDDEKVLNYYSCALIGDILLQGHLYITKNYFAFYSNVFGYVTKLLIPMLSVEKITKEKTARIIPNAVGIATSEDKHVFGSLMSRDNTYRYMLKVWEVAQNASSLVVEPEIEPVPVSDSDSSETREGESGRESPTPITRLVKIPNLTNKENLTTVKDSATSDTKHQLEFLAILKQGISKFASLPRQSMILFATTLLLILLFLSAAVLLYRISKIQNKFTFALHEAAIPNDNQDIYNNLFQWQTHLHSKSAGAVHNFLDSNLDQIAKVRQSLEALSTLLMPNNRGDNSGSAGTNPTIIPTADKTTENS